MIPDANKARTELESMTDEQRDALPLFEPFGCDRYLIPESGEVELPNGRKLSGLTPGNYISIPKQQDRAYASFIGDETPLAWRDKHGTYWRPVLTQDGWKKAPAR